MILSTIVLEDRQSLPCFTNSCPCIDFKKKKRKKKLQLLRTDWQKSKQGIVFSRPVRKMVKPWKKKKRKAQTKEKQGNDSTSGFLLFVGSVVPRDAISRNETQCHRYFFRIAHQPDLFASLLFVSTGSLGGNSAKNERLPTFFFFPVRAEKSSFFDICIELWSNSFGYFN